MLCKLAHGQHRRVQLNFKQKKSRVYLLTLVESSCFVIQFMHEKCARARVKAKTEDDDDAKSCIELASRRSYL